MKIDDFINCPICCRRLVNEDDTHYCRRVCRLCYPQSKIPMSGQPFATFVAGAKDYKTEISWLAYKLDGEISLLVNFDTNFTTVYASDGALVELKQSIPIPNPYDIDYVKSKTKLLIAFS